MNSYLVNLTFHAGSDAPEDTDNKLYLLQTTRQVTLESVKNDFIHANTLLDTFNEDPDVELSTSYDDGLNIDTLVAGYKELTNDIIEELNETTHFPTLISNYFAIEQYQ